MRAFQQLGRGFLGTIVALFGCQENEPRPPRAAACNPGQFCDVGEIGVTPSSGGSTGSGGRTSTLPARTGDVLDLVDDTFRRSVPYADPALVEAEGAIQPLVSARWNGVEPFEIEEFRELSTTWFSVRPETGSFHLRTLHPIPLEAPDPLELGVVRADSIDFIYSAFPLPVERIPGYAQVVLSFTEGSPPRPLAGVNVVSSAAAFVAYQFGGDWTLEADRTDASGMVILGNIAGSVFPGTEVRATLALAGKPKGFIRIQVASDAVTIVEVPILP